LGRNQNVEAYVIRIQRNRKVGWKFVESDPLELRAAPDAEPEEEDQGRGSCAPF
jgi:hypothetical protein